VNRLQKKCIIASAGIHLLLGLVLLVGPGFLSSRPAKIDDVPLLDFVPVKTVDELISGGGNPKATPPAAQPLPPQAQPPPKPEPPAPALPQQRDPDPQPTRQPDAAKEPVPDFKDEDGIDTTKKPKPRKIEISTTLVTRKREPSPDKRAKEEAQAREEAKTEADARRRLAHQLGQVAENIGNEVSGGTSIELKGPGGGGVPYANWRSAIRTIYERAWLLPEGIINDDATTSASITIAKDGKVLSAYINKPSRDPVVDRSVLAALNRVSNTPPLPETATEPKRTIIIFFSVRAKRALG
jgi:TonB family protein